MEEEAKEYAQRCIHDIQNTIEDAYKSGFSNGYEKGLHENTDPYNFTNLNYSIANPLNPYYKKQRQKRGFDETELVSLNNVILKFALPRIKELKNIYDNGGMNVDMSHIKDLEDKYKKSDNPLRDIYADMIEGIERTLNYRQFTKENLRLFFKYFTYLNY